MSTTVQKNIDQLQKTLQSVKNYKTTIYVEFNGSLKEAQVTADEHCKFIRSYVFESPGMLSSKHTGHDTVAEAFAELTKLLSGATIFLETMTVTSEQPNLTGSSRAAWCDALNCPNDQTAATKDADESRMRILKAKLWGNLTSGDAGVQQWNQVHIDSRRLINWSDSKLSNAKLKGANLSGSLDFSNSDFDKAQLEGASFATCNISNATFRGANLSKANLTSVKAEAANFEGTRMVQAGLNTAKLRGAIFKDTDLTKAQLQHADLRGVDLSSACLKETKMQWASYDQTTILPANFSQWSTLRWTGQGPDPFKEYIKQKINNGVATFDEFVDHLQTSHIEAGRLTNAFKMLKKERFDLFSEVHDKNITGVVKSQTDPDLIYACALTENGSYTCCTQNLRPCGGLKGEVCKHILVLMIGLAKGSKVDLTAATKWLLKTMNQQPNLDKTAMSDVFMRFKSALTGEIDWRPTETIPEDYYAF